MSTINVDGHHLTIENVVQTARAANGEISLRLTPEAKARVSRAAQAVADIVRKGEVVYGITTGFGAFKDRIIPHEQLRALQQNIVRSHSAGTGAPLSREVVRAMMLIRANTLASGHSGVRLDTLDLLLRMIERGVHPVIPRQGSLGASGDLAQLAHMALVMMGEGWAEVEGEILPGAKALARVGLTPVTLGPKEGLALTNGTAFMVALGCLAVVEAENCAFVADVAGALSLEALHGTTAAFDARIHALRPHPRQKATAALLRRLLEGSDFVRTDLRTDPQDAYTLRCMPQVHGACADAVAYARWVVEIELNSVTDNPLIFFEEDGSATAISGGNFHGEPLAIAYDYLALAMTELGNISERRLNRLIDPACNRGLPAFLTERGGIHSGFMLTQYTAAALASENKAMCHPASADTIPTSANVEDHVSNGPIAGRQARRVLRNLEQILGIELMAAAQAIDFRRRALGADARLGRGGAAAYEVIREHIPFLSQDAALSPYMLKAAQLVASGAIREAVQNRLAATPHPAQQAS
ncbi:MAG: histidine ammonia-lyase [Chloroflexi bacterium]|nr:histidine ammonia-lyase [Chloroflexota bacterium]